VAHFRLLLLLISQAYLLFSGMDHSSLSICGLSSAGWRKTFSSLSLLGPGFR